MSSSNSWSWSERTLRQYCLTNASGNCSRNQIMKAWSGSCGRGLSSAARANTSRTFTFSFFAVSVTRHIGSPPFLVVNRSASYTLTDKLERNRSVGYRTGKPVRKCYLSNWCGGERESGSLWQTYKGSGSPALHTRRVAASKAGKRVKPVVVLYLPILYTLQKEKSVDNMVIYFLKVDIIRCTVVYRPTNRLGNPHSSHWPDLGPCASIAGNSPHTDRVRNV